MDVTAPRAVAAPASKLMLIHRECSARPTGAGLRVIRASNDLLIMVFLLITPPPQSVAALANVELALMRNSIGSPMSHQTDAVSVKVILLYDGVVDTFGSVSATSGVHAAVSVVASDSTPIYSR
jgi:hypothetical protein